MRRLPIAFVFLALLLVASPLAARTWLVPSEAPTIQAGIDSAAVGDTVEVACGTYTWTGQGTGDANGLVHMKAGVHLRSATGDTSCVTIDAEGMGRVLYFEDWEETDPVILEGLTITGGQISEYGAGLFHAGASLTLTKCSFRGNRATGGGGGGVRCLGYALEDSLIVSDCSFSQNYASQSGGGLNCSEFESFALTGCSFVADSADGGGGGGLWSWCFYPGTLTGCVFAGNRGEFEGGAVGTWDSEMSITDCTFSDNAAYQAGAILTYRELHLSGCVFARNQGDWGTGGVQFEGSGNSLTHCTFYGNSSGSASEAAAILTFGTLAVDNTIVAFNGVGEPVVTDGGGATLSCTDVFGNAGGDWVGNIAGQELLRDNFSVDPLFCDTTSVDFSVAPGSPCLGGVCGQVGAFGAGECLGSLPALVTLTDVGNDQGRELRLRWRRSLFDAPGDTVDITGYSIYRRQDGFRADGWDDVGWVPAYGDSIYQFVAPTLCDSTAASGICWSAFFVRAATPDPFTFFNSYVDSGYSVDNLQPSPPGGLLAEAEAGGIALTWVPNEEEDLDYYSVYRGMDSGFTPEAPIGYSAEASYHDGDLPGPGTYYYKITATDFAGNESDPSAPSGTTTDAPGSLEIVPGSAFLGAAVPNPFGRATEIRYGIPGGTRDAAVRLDVFDVRGRRVRTLVDRVQEPGTYRVQWNGRDRDERAVASGVYFYRLTWCDFAETRRMVLLR